MTNAQATSYLQEMTSLKTIRSRSVTYRTDTPEVADLLDNVVRMAGHDVTLLLVGETGTGKTTLARLIHELSPRREARLLTVACGAMPRELIESELFGHVKGAFTSAEKSKVGKFDAAENGTLLLDEIDVLGPAQQVKLLRVIETGEFEPVGCNDTRHSRARLIVASNVNLKGLVDRNEFRADLYYRLNMLEFRIPPLRERVRDIVPLALGFIEELSQSHEVDIRRIHPEFLDCLKRYHWPGNIRELKNYIRRAILFCQSGELTPNDLAQHLSESSAGDASAIGPAGGGKPDEHAPLTQRVAHSERKMLEEALCKHNNNRTATASALGLSRVGLYKKLKRHGMVQWTAPPAMPELLGGAMGSIESGCR